MRMLQQQQHSLVRLPVSSRWWACSCCLSRMADPFCWFMVSRWLDRSSSHLGTFGSGLKAALEWLLQHAVAAIAMGRRCHLVFQAKASPRVDVGDTSSGVDGIDEMPPSELGPGTTFSV